MLAHQKWMPRLHHKEPRSYPTFSPHYTRRLFRTVSCCWVYRLSTTAKLHRVTEPRHPLRYAADANRKGFRIGLGLGTQKAYVRNNSWLAPSSIKSEQTVAGTFQLGYGVSNKFAFPFVLKIGSVSIDDRKGSIAIGGIGAAYYFSRNSPFFNLSALGGKGYVSVEDESEELDDSGSGSIFSIGYEINDRIQLELSGAFFKLKDQTIAINKSLADATFVTLQYFW